MRICLNEIVANFLQKGENIIGLLIFDEKQKRYEIMNVEAHPKYGLEIHADSRNNNLS